MDDNLPENQIVLRAAIFSCNQLQIVIIYMNTCQRQKKIITHFTV